MTRRPYTWQELVIVLALIVQITGVLVILAFRTIPPQNTALFASVAAGGVVATFLTWGNYRWGSSGNAETKDQQFQALMQSVVELAKVNSQTTLAPPAPISSDALDKMRAAISQVSAPAHQATRPDAEQ